MNQFLGIIAVVGEDGTIKVPLDMLQTAGIKPNSKVELFSDASNLFIRTAEKFCDICGTNTNTTTIGSQEICKSCLDKIAQATQESQSKASE